MGALKSKLELIEMELSMKATGADVHSVNQVRAIVIGALEILKDEKSLSLFGKELVKLVGIIESKTGEKLL